jgi:glyoxylase-like metal-dependent hydrolase (beta-lactamase superfamily II)
MKIQHFFDKDTATFSYIVIDSKTNKCAIIDSVLDYDAQSGKIDTKSANILIDYINNNNLVLEWILETHIHADHMTASHYIKEKLGGKTAIGANITKVLQYWVKLFNSYKDTKLDGSQFDYLFNDGDVFNIGDLQVKVLSTAGHTPACISYLIDDAIFVGDTIFMPYMGTARADFPDADAKTLYHSIKKILSLPLNTKIYTCHDYPNLGDEPKYMSLVSEQRNSNIMINDKVSEEEYIKARNQKDVGKAVPKLLLPAIQVNLRGGKIGEAEDNGISYIKIPINQF